MPVTYQPLRCFVGLEASNIYAGEGVIVMNIDSGVELTYPALQNTWHRNEPGIPASPAWIDPHFGHPHLPGSRKLQFAADDRGKINDRETGLPSPVPRLPSSSREPGKNDHLPILPCFSLPAPADCVSVHRCGRLNMLFYSIPLPTCLNEHLSQNRSPPEIPKMQPRQEPG